MFDKIKAKIEELKAEIESAVNADEVKADEAALSLLQGWTDGLTALKKVLEDREKPAETPAPVEPAQEAKGDASEPGSEAPAVQVETPASAESQAK